MSAALAIAIGLLGAVVFLGAIYFGVGQNPGSALADWMLEAGGDRKAHYRPLRAVAFAAFAIGLCFLLWAVPRGHVQPSAVHSEHIAGFIALCLLVVSMVLFVAWWLLAGRKTRDE